MRMLLCDMSFYVDSNETCEKEGCVSFVCVFLSLVVVARAVQLCSVFV